MIGWWLPSSREATTGSHQDLEDTAERDRMYVLHRWQR